MNGSPGRASTAAHPGRRAGTMICGVLVAGLLAGCSLRNLVIDKTGDALASGGSSFAADDDPELIRDAAPLSLKLMESLLAERPNHRGLLFATASGFTQYSYAFVQQDAEALEDNDLAAAAALRERAQRLYRRARDYGLRGLDVSHPGFSARLRADPQAAVRVARPPDVPLLYWTAASWAALMSISKDDPEVLADLPVMEALVDRALALDEAYDHGAVHTFLISYEMVRQGGPGDPELRARALRAGDRTLRGAAGRALRGTRRGRRDPETGPARVPGPAHPGPGNRSRQAAALAAGEYRPAAPCPLAAGTVRSLLHRVEEPP